VVREHPFEKAPRGFGLSMYRRNPPVFDTALASSAFRKWFAGACPEVKNEDGSPKIFYRGQRQGNSLQARLVLDSFTTIPEVASMYTGEVGSVFPVYLSMKNPLVIDAHFLTFYDLMAYLDYWNDGITHEDSVKILNFLVSRLEKGSLYNFQYEVRRYEGGFFEGSDLRELRKHWNYSEDEPREDQESIAENLAVDTFAFVETPAFKRTLEKLGYDGVIHLDPVGQRSLEKSSGKKADDIEGIYDGYRDYEWPDMSADYVHWTYRPLSREQVWPALLYEEDRPAWE